MKDNEKKVSILVEESGPSKESNLHDDTKSNLERLKKPLIFLLMGVVFLGCMYLIFKPSPDKEEMENIGLNDSVPQASETGMQADKQKAYEEAMLEQKNQEKRNALTTLSDYWNEDSPSGDEKEATPEEQDENSEHGGTSVRSGNPALNSYRSARSTLGSFYQNDGSETQQLRKQLDELKDKLAEKDVSAGMTANDQLALMEKSYQMAAKYLPMGSNTGDAAKNNEASASTAQAVHFAPFTPSVRGNVSALYREPADSTFLANWSEARNRRFNNAGSGRQVAQPKNSVKACVQETLTIIGESGVRLRLLEPAKTPNHIVPPGTILTANANFNAGRLQLQVTSIELDGNIIPVDITIYDLDGQQGLYVPYSPEMNALKEAAGNMSQTSGTSVMLTQSAGQQVAADLSRGVVQGISGYFSKKVKTSKVTVKAGHQVLLVSKK